MHKPTFSGVGSDDGCYHLQLGPAAVRLCLACTKSPSVQNRAWVVQYSIHTGAIHMSHWELIDWHSWTLPGSQWKALLDNSLESDSWCNPVGWGWFITTKDLAHHVYHFWKHLQKLSNSVAGHWRGLFLSSKCSFQKEGVIEHRAVIHSLLSKY